jgi:hypothetical protein
MRSFGRWLSASVVLLLSGAVPAVSAIALTARAATAWSHTIDVDQRRALTPLDLLVPEIERTCQTSEQVTVKVTSRFGEFATTVGCDSVKGHGSASIATKLVQAAAGQNRAAAKADRVIALHQKLIPDEPFDRDEMIWALATGNGLTCERAKRPSDIRKQMAIANQAAAETPEHWTLVEAVWIAGACPQHLPALYQMSNASDNPTPPPQ